jgi:transcriptional regulator with XRE-family HTH domain
MSQNKDKLGIKIRLLRLQKGIKQEELCKAIDISQSKLSRIENCQIEITENQLNKLCLFMNVTVQEIQDVNSLTTSDILSLFEAIKKENSDLKLMMKDVFNTLKLMLKQKIE